MNQSSDLEALFSTLRRHIVLIIFSAVAAAAATFGLSTLEAEQYRASSTLLYAPDRFAVDSGTDPERRISTLVVLAKSDPVLREVATGLPPEWSVERLSRSIDVKEPGDSELIEVTVVAPRPDDAAEIANATAAAFVDWRLEQQRDHIRARMSSLRGQLNGLAGRTAPSDLAAAADLRTQLAQAAAEFESPTSDVTFVEPARVPTAPVAPKPVRNAIIGFVAGLVIGLVLAGIRDRVDRRLRYVDDVEEAYRAPVLGVLPHVRRAARGKRSAGLADFRTSSALADAFRSIRTNIELMNIDGPRRQVIVVSSAIPSEGKSGVVANLALAFASAGRHVLVIGADLRSPSIHEYFDLPPAGADGLLQALWGARPLSDAADVVSLNGASPRGGGSVAILATRQRPPDPASLLQSQALARLIADARTTFDVILLDSPPLLVSADASALGQQADGLLLVARLGRLTRHEARRAAKILSTSLIAPIGIVASGRPEHHLGSYGYGYGEAHDAEAPITHVSSGT